MINDELEPAMPEGIASTRNTRIEFYFSNEQRYEVESKKGKSINDEICFRDSWQNRH